MTEKQGGRISKEGFSPITRIVKITVAGVSILFSLWGGVSQGSEEFNDQVRGTTNLCQNLSREGKEFRNVLATLSQPYPSLQKTIKLNENQKEAIIEALKKFVDANVYLENYDIKQKGEINSWPDRDILMQGIRELVVKALESKVVNDYRSAEIYLERIEIIVNRWSEKREPIIRGVLEARTVEPHIIITLYFVDTSERLKPQALPAISGYSRIPIQDLSRRGNGNFNYNELNAAVSEAINNLIIFIRSSKREASFQKLTESLTNPVLSMEGCIIDTREKTAGIYWIIKANKEELKYLQAGSKIKIYSRKEEQGRKKDILLEELIIGKDVFYDSTLGIAFVKSGRFKSAISEGNNYFLLENNNSKIPYDQEFLYAIVEKNESQNN